MYTLITYTLYIYIYTLYIYAYAFYIYIYIMGVFVRYGFYKTPNDAPGPSRISPPNLNGREPSAAGACQASKRGLGRLEMTKKNGGLMWFAHGE